LRGKAGKTAESAVVTLRREVMANIVPIECPNRDAVDVAVRTGASADGNTWSNATVDCHGRKPNICIQRLDCRLAVCGRGRMVVNEDADGRVTLGEVVY
jgi:hypothetical protein